MSVELHQGAMQAVEELAIACQKGGEQSKLQDVCDNVQPLGRPWIRYASVRLVLTTMTVVTCLLGWNWLYPSSLHIALAYLRGERLIIDPSVAFVDDVRGGEKREITFRVFNFIPQPVKLVGGNSTCTCVATKDLPLDVPSGESRSVSVMVHSPNGRSRFEEKVTFYTSCPEKPRLVVQVVGSVNKVEGENDGY